jgi:hypothetical protein
MEAQEKKKPNQKCKLSVDRGSRLMEVCPLPEFFFLTPVLRRVIHAPNFDQIFAQAIHNHIRQRRKQKLSRPFDTPRPLGHELLRTAYAELVGGIAGDAAPNSR